MLAPPASRLPSVAGWPAGLWLLAASAPIALGICPDVGSLMIAALLVLAGLYFHRSGHSRTRATANAGRELRPERRLARSLARDVGVRRRSRGELEVHDNRALCSMNRSATSARIIRASVGFLLRP